MATETIDPDEAVSAEAHTRVKDQNAALQTKVDELSKTVTDLGTKEIVRSHFATKGMAPDDAEWATTVAMPSIPETTPADQLSTYLDENFARLYPADTPPPDAPPVDGAETPPDAGDFVPTPDANEPPGFARPSPAGDGQPPGVQEVTVDSDEYKQLLASGDEAGLQSLVRSDRFRFVTQTLDQPG